MIAFCNKQIQIPPLFSDCNLQISLSLDVGLEVTAVMRT